MNEPIRINYPRAIIVFRFILYVYNCVYKPPVHIHSSIAEFRTHLANLLLTLSYMTVSSVSHALSVWLAIICTHTATKHHIVFDPFYDSVTTLKIINDLFTLIIA